MESVPTESSETRKLCIAQYWRGRDGNGRVLPLHWALFAISNLTPEPLATSRATDLHDHLGVCFQAIGNMVNFEYSCTEECVEVLADEYRGCLLIGEGDYAVVEDLVKRVQVYRGREDWNCQNWVLGAVEKLKRRGCVGENVTANAIRHELDEMWKNWDNKMN